MWFAFQGLAVLPACLTAMFVFGSPQPVISADGGALGSRHPCSATEFLKANRLSGTVFGAAVVGLVSHLGAVSVDSRVDGRPEHLAVSHCMVVENFDFYSNDASEADLDSPLRYATNRFLVPADSPVLSRLATDWRWRQVFRDGDAALFARSEAFLPALVLPPSAWARSSSETVTTIALSSRAELARLPHTVDHGRCFD